MLDDITLYWLTNTGASASRFYWENNNNNFSAEAQKTKDIKIPVAISVFPKEIYRAPESWSKQAYPTLYYYREVEEGWTFRSLGTASTFYRGAASGLQVCPLTQLSMRTRTSSRPSKA